MAESIDGSNKQKKSGAVERTGTKWMDTADS